MDANCGIYKCVNPSGQIYIGQTRNFKQRFKHYKAAPNKSMPKKLFLSLKEHGFDNHSFELILPYDSSVSKSELNYAECYLMRYYEADSSNNLNIRGGGLDGKLAESTKQKLREWNLGKTYGKEHRSKCGRVITREQRNNSRKANIGINNAFYGKSHSQELLSIIGSKVSEQFKKRISLGIKTNIYTRIDKIDIDTGMVIDSYKSVAEAARLNSIGKNHIHDVLSKRIFINCKDEEYIRTEAGGFNWHGEIQSNFKIVKKDIKTKEIIETYDSIKDASSKNKISYSSISNCVTRKVMKRKDGSSFVKMTTGGFIWEKQIL